MKSLCRSAGWPNRRCARRCAVIFTRWFHISRTARRPNSPDDCFANNSRRSKGIRRVARELARGHREQVRGLNMDELSVTFHGRPFMHRMSRVFPTTDRTYSLPAVLRWTPAGRFIVFFLSATSIWCLLAEFYGLCSMQTFTLWILIPATFLLIAMALLDRA